MAGMGGAWGAGGTLFRPTGGPGGAPTPGAPYRVASIRPQAASGAPASVPRAPAGASPWTAPPVPAGFYNPIRDVEEAEGKRGSEQALTGDERTRTTDENTFATNVTLQGEKESTQAQQAQETLARLAESYKKLGVKQGEGANQRGLLSGGALMQSAMKRAANEGLAQRTDELARQQQLQADENERGKMATEESNLVGPGGSLVEAMQNARVNQQAFDEGITKLKGDEAAANGYIAPTGPAARGAARRASAAPRIASVKPQPVSGGGGRAILTAARRKGRL